MMPIPERWKAFCQGAADASECYRFLQDLSMGRGLHAPMAYINVDGAVTVHRRNDNQFQWYSAQAAAWCWTRSLVRRAFKWETYRPRYIITKKGRQAVGAR